MSLHLEHPSQAMHAGLESLLMDERVYVAFYKPYGVITSFTDPEGRKTLKEYIGIADIYPAGRLDLDSEGLMLLTNDGALAHRITSPDHHHPKTYLVQVEGTPTREALSRLEGGVEVKGRLTRKAQVMVVPEPDLPPRAKPVTPHGPTAWLRLVLTEGKKRQIRHMTAAVGLPTLRLVRISIGPVSLDGLQPGDWRHLTPEETAALKELPGRRRTARPGRKKAEKPGRPGNQLVKTGGKPGGYPGSTRGSRYRSGGRRSPGR